MKSIQTKFIALILGGVLFASCTVGYVAALTTERVIDEDSAQIMNLLCREKAQVINALLLRIEQSVDTLSAYAVEQLQNVIQLQNDDAYMKEYTRNILDIALNTADHTNGARTVYLRFNPDLLGSTAGFFWGKAVQGSHFQQLDITDLIQYPKESVEHVGWYTIPIERGKATWLGLYQNENIDVDMISYVVPLYKDNTVLGVLGMDIDINALNDIVDLTHVYESGYAFMVDADAKIVYHPEIDTNTAMDDLEDSLHPVAERLRNGSAADGLYPYVWRGEAKQMSVVSLVNGMRLAITVSTSEIDAAKNALILQSLLALCVITILFLTLTVIMTRKIIAPLKQLNIAARKISEGDLTVDLTYQTTDEVGTLANSFRKMVDHLTEHIDYINGLAYRDGLTGIKNKTAYNEISRRLEKDMCLGRPEFAFVVFDINNLKIVNDTKGHNFGDMLIINVSKIICKVFQHSPVYRIGGDEFIAVLEHIDYQHYQERLNEFQTALDEFNKSVSLKERISVARGIALYEENTDLTIADVFRRADNAMYQNKEALKQKDF